MSFIHSVHTDPRTHLHNPGDSVGPDREALALFDRWDEQWNQYGFGYYTMFAVEDGRPVGFCGFKTSRLGGHEALNTFCRLEPDSWQQGFASEAVGLLLQSAGSCLPDWPVVARVRPSNTASRRLVARLEFQHVLLLGVVGEDGYEDVFVRNWPDLVQTPARFNELPDHMEIPGAEIRAVSTSSYPSVTELCEQRREDALCVEGLDTCQLSAGGLDVLNWELSMANRRQSVGSLTLTTCTTCRPEGVLAIDLASLSLVDLAVAAAERFVVALEESGRPRIWATARQSAPLAELLTALGFVPDHESSERAVFRRELERGGNANAPQAHS